MITPSFGIFLMMNNYLHDVATALLLASAFTMWIQVKRLGEARDREVISYTSHIYRDMSRLALISLVWIVIGGIPRVIYYREFEWAHAAGRDQVTALIVKHILFIIFIGTGFYMWKRIRKRIEDLRNMVQ